MTNVFVVTVKRDWHEVEVEGVFTTFQKAQEFCESLSEDDRINSTITPCEVK